MMLRRWSRAALAALGMAFAIGAQAGPITVTFLHTNDIHAHVEPVKIRGKEYGGYARLATAILEQTKKSENPVVLDAGDVFQGTLYFNVYEGLADLAFLNLLGYQVMAIGNHEFDRGVGPLETFVKLAKFPVIAANLNLEKEPALKDIVKGSHVLTVAGEQIGVIGAVTADLPTITNLPASVTMKPIIDSIQREANALQSRGIDKIVLLSHCGYRADLDLAAKLKNVDVIIGGHSHTLLGKFSFDGAPAFVGDYPTITKGADGNPLLVVQAWEWGKVLGKLRVTWDEKGIVTSWEGSEPILIDETIEENPYVESLITAFRKPIEALKTQKIGETTTLLTKTFEYGEDGLMANVITDAMLAQTKRLGVVTALMNAGGVRNGIEPGPITYGQAIEVQPFGNTLVTIELTGAELKAALEHGVARLPESAGGLLYPSAGTSYTVDINRPAGDRITSLTIDGKAVEPGKTYKVCTNSFTANGGDGHTILKEAKGARVDTGYVDIDALIEHIKAKTPLSMKNEGRLVIRR